MKPYLALLLSGVAAANLSDMDLKFVNYMAVHNKQYPSLEDYMMRFEIFQEAEAAIRANEADPESTHQMKHNMFSDWTNEEFKSVIGILDAEPQSYEGNEACAMPFDSDFDWDYQHKAISPVKFAGVCGASWAFAATAAIEASYAIKN